MGTGSNGVYQRTDGTGVGHYGDQGAGDPAQAAHAAAAAQAPPGVKLGVNWGNYTRPDGTTGTIGDGLTGDPNVSYAGSTFEGGQPGNTSVTDPRDFFYGRDPNFVQEHGDEARQFGQSQYDLFGVLGGNSLLTAGQAAGFDQSAGQNLFDRGTGQWVKSGANTSREMATAGQLGDTAQQQLALAGQVGGATGQSAADAQLQSGLNQSEASNLALARSGRGFGQSGAALGQAINANAAAGQQTANNAAQLRLQSQQAAAGIYGQGANTQQNQANIYGQASQQQQNAALANQASGINVQQAGYNTQLQGQQLAGQEFAQGAGQQFAGMNAEKSYNDAQQSSDLAHEQIAEQQYITASGANTAANALQAQQTGAIIGAAGTIAGAAIGTLAGGPAGGAVGAAAGGAAGSAAGAQASDIRAKANVKPADGQAATPLGDIDAKIEALLRGKMAPRPAAPVMVVAAPARPAVMPHYGEEAGYYHTPLGFDPAVDEAAARQITFPGDEVASDINSKTRIEQLEGHMQSQGMNPPAPLAPVQHGIGAMQQAAAAPGMYQGPLARPSVAPMAPGGQMAARPMGAPAAPGFAGNALGGGQQAARPQVAPGTAPGLQQVYGQAQAQMAARQQQNPMAPRPQVAPAAPAGFGAAAMGGAGAIASDEHSKTRIKELENQLEALAPKPAQHTASEYYQAPNISNISGGANIGQAIARASSAAQARADAANAGQAGGNRPYARPLNLPQFAGRGKPPTLPGGAPPTPSYSGPVYGMTPATSTDTWQDRVLAQQLRDGSAQGETPDSPETYSPIDTSRSDWLDQYMAHQGAVTSDENAKTGVSGSGELGDAFSGLHGYSYDYRDPARHGSGRQYGFMAQDLAQTPAGASAIKIDPKDGTMMVDSGKLAMMQAPVVGAHERKIGELEAQLDALLGKRADRQGTVAIVPRAGSADMSALDAAQLGQGGSVYLPRGGGPAARPMQVIPVEVDASEPRPWGGVDIAALDEAQRRQGGTVYGSTY